LDDLPLAHALYIEALKLKPDMEEGMINLGTLLEKMGDREGAMSMFHNLLESTDDAVFKAGACNNLGHIHHKSVGSRDVLNLQKAKDYYLLALSFDETHVDSMYNLGKVLQEMGDQIGAKVAYERVLVEKHDHHLARLNLGNYYFNVGENEKAVREYEKLTSSSTSAVQADILEMAYNNMGQVYRDADLHREAEHSFREAMRVSGYASNLALVNYYVARRTLNEWEGVGDIVGRILSVQENVNELKLQPYDSCLLGDVSPQTRKLIAQKNSAPYEKMKRVVLPSSVMGSEPSTGRGRGRLTVAYLSYDFRDHPMGHLTSGLVLGHTKSEFEVAAVSYGKDDGSNTRLGFENGAEIFLDCVYEDNDGKNNVNALKSAEEVAALGVEIVVDLMAHTRGAIYQLPSLKPGIILINYLGFPGTTGASYFDYAMVDSIVVPPEVAEGSWTEKIIYLPDCYQANTYGGLQLPSVRPAVVRNKAEGNERGNGKEGYTVNVCNYNTIDKIEQTSFSSWMNFLRENPSTKLTLLDPNNNNPQLANAIRENLLLEAKSRGVHPRRVTFGKRMKHAQHVRRISSECDLFIDSFVYGGHTTMADFLYAGVPSFTLGGYGVDNEGSFGGMPSRVGKSLIKNLGVDEELFVVDSVKNIETIDIDFLVLNELRRIVVSVILEGGGNSFDTERITQNVETAYKVVWELNKLKSGDKHVIIMGSDGDGVSGGGNTNEMLDDEKKAVMLEEAISAVNSGNGELVTEKFVSTFAKNPDAWHLYALARRKTDAHTAIKALLKAIDLATKVPGFFYSNLGSIQMDVGMSRDAAESFLMAIEVDPVSQIEGGNGERVLDLLWGSGDEEYETAVRKIMNSDSSLRQLFYLASNKKYNDDFFTTMVLDDGEGNKSFPLEVAKIFARHATNLLSSTDPQSTTTDLCLSLLKIATILDKRNTALGLKFGAAIEQYADPSEGDAGEAALSQFFDTVLSIQETEYTHFMLEKNDHPGGGGERPTVAIFCAEYGQTWWPNWGPKSAQRGGVGGSEEAVIFLSRELVQLGYNVVVYAEPLEEDVSCCCCCCCSMF